MYRVKDFKFTFELAKDNLYRIRVEHLNSDLICILRTNDHLLINRAFTIINDVDCIEFNNMYEARQEILKNIFKL